MLNIGPSADRWQWFGRFSTVLRLILDTPLA
jgi:hypothetical protein